MIFHKAVQCRAWQYKKSTFTTYFALFAVALLTNCDIVLVDHPLQYFCTAYHLSVRVLPRRVYDHLLIPVSSVNTMYHQNQVEEGQI